jgi:hypothetical protein
MANATTSSNKHMIVHNVPMSNGQLLKKSDVPWAAAAVAAAVVAAVAALPCCVGG